MSQYLKPQSGHGQSHFDSGSSSPKTSTATAVMPVQKCHGIFNCSNGRNILEDRYPTDPDHFVTVFFDWEDRLCSDEQLMTLMIVRITARNCVITPEPVHHNIRWCLSLRVPAHYEPSEISITAYAKVIAEWHREEIMNSRLQIDRSYLFRKSHLPKRRYTIIPCH